MADFYPPLTLEIFTAVHAVWPEIVLPGSGAQATCFTSLSALMVNIIEEQKAQNDGDSTYSVPLPWAVVDIGIFTPDQGWGVASMLSRAPVTIWYIDAFPKSATSGSNQKDINVKVYDLATYFDQTQNAFTNFQVIEKSATDSGPDNAFNAYMRSALKTNLIGASVSWSPGFLVGP
jgi:hypothetical protein